MRKLLCLISLIIFLTPKYNYFQNNYDFEKLDQYIKSAVELFSVPGLAVGIIKNGEVLFANGYGLRSNESSDSVNAETIFGIASLSKAFTSASIGMLVDDGKLKWSDRVIDHLPWFKLYDPYITREIKIFDLLSHRVGLATFDGDLLWYGTNYSREEIVKRISEMPIKNGFREKYGYQNVMFLVAGELMKEVTGKTWEEFVEERIFIPLGMSNSTVTNSVINANTNTATPHLEGKVQDFINYDNSGPAASINSCVDDMLKWAKFWINEGMVDSIRLLSIDSYNTITSPYMSISAGNRKEIGGTHFIATGLGWFLSDYAGRKVLAHGGGLPGFLSRIAIVPEDSLGIVVFQNDMHPVYRDITRKILDLFLTDKNVDYVGRSWEREKEREEWEKRRNEEKESSRIKNTNPSYELEKYQGSYFDKMYGDAEIKFANGELTLVLLPTRKLFISKMTHWHFDTFKIKFADEFLPEGFVTFNKNSKGEITDFTIDLPNPDFHFYNLKFEKQ